MRIQMIKAFFVFVVMLMQAPTWAALPYSQPFPGFISSGYGPRLHSSSFHGGLDYAKPRGISIPAIMDGQITEISSNLSGAGIRLYLQNNTDKKEIGYYHLFTYTQDSKPVKSGRFILLKNYEFSAFLPSVRVKKIVEKCDVILNTVDKKAYVPPSCWGIVLMSKSNVLYKDENDITTSYTPTNTVKKGDLIAPVGNSLHNKITKNGTVTETFTVPPHLHIQHGRLSEATHPMYVLEPIAGNGQLYARLDLTGTETNNTNVPVALTTDPTVSQEVLAQNKFIDVRVDSTDRLDLDGFEFNIYPTNPSKPNLFGQVRYSFPNRSINFIPKDIGQFKESIDTKTCRRDLKPGEVVICPEVNWQGETSGQRLVTRFRLGVDPDMFAPGINTVNVTLKHVNQLPELQEIPLNFTVETKPISARGVTLLSASCNKIAEFRWLVTSIGTASGPIGTRVHNSVGFDSFGTTESDSLGSCGNWSKKIFSNSQFNYPAQCVREVGQPETTNWTLSSVFFTDTQEPIINALKYFEVYASDSNPPYNLIASNQLSGTCGFF